MIDTILWATDNSYEIPALNPLYMPENLTMPLVTWGSVARRATMPGTWHFYTDDYRFNGLLNHPDQLIRSGCVAAIEPNITIPPDCPLPIGLYRIYKKRWIARYWQSQGIAVWVDLNVDPKFMALNLLGVPPGWRAFFTRGYNANIDQINAEYQAAQNVGGPDILFTVYGGGAAVQSAALANGWAWLPERADVIRGAR